MKFIETLKLAAAAIWAHKLRSALTLLGMIIGVTAVVVVVSLIQGFNTYVDEKIANIGAKSFSIYRFDFLNDFKDTDTIAAAQRRNKELTLEDYEFLRSRTVLIDQLGARAAPTASEVKRHLETLEGVPVGGATANIAIIEKTDIASGRFFTETENEAAARVAFIGADVAEQLLPYISPVYDELAIAGGPCRVIGVAAAKGTVFGRPQDNFIVVAVRTYARNVGRLVRQRWLYFLGTASDNLFNDAVEEARQAMRQR